MTDLFIGVVSHEGSRFSVNQGPTGLAAQLAERLAERGVSCAVQVNTQDAYDPDTLPIDGRLVHSSLTQQMRLEGQWSHFLSVGRPTSTASRLASTAIFLARRLRQTVLYERPWHGSDRTDSTGSRMIRRLINIELSHVDLWQSGLASGAPWLLVIEDDASSPDLDDCADGIAGLLDNAGDQPAYVNLSISFTPTELGVEHLISGPARETWAGPRPRAVLATSRPVTNTVCAIAYRADFVERLLREFEALPMAPVVPIDWKLNLALMRMFERGDLIAGDCWLVEPGPIVQMSMQTEVGA